MFQPMKVGLQEASHTEASCVYTKSPARHCLNLYCRTWQRCTVKPRAITTSNKYPLYFHHMKIFTLLFLLFVCQLGAAQSPELALREFASGQIKKGVRSIGMGGDGATWGNYSLVYRDSSTGLLDAGNTSYTNGNNFSFTAVGVTTPTLWHRLTIYAIALSQNANNISSVLKSPGFGNTAIQTTGHGNNQAIFVKSAMPIGKKFAAGILLSYERSQFDGVSTSDNSKSVSYHTNWLPSGGFGVSYQATAKILFGLRAILNNDKEVRVDNSGTATGRASSQEYRLGASLVAWKGAILDAGLNWRKTQNKIRNATTTAVEPNIGFEQNLWQRHFAFRFGLDETSETAGISLKFLPLVADIAYVHNLGMSRIKDVFGTSSNSVLATLVFNFEHYLKARKHGS